MAGLHGTGETVPGAGSERDRVAEDTLEGRPQDRIHLRHRHRDPEVDEARDAVPPHAAGHDAGEMGEVRLDVEADAVERHPAPDADADGGDLVLGGLRRLVGAADPDADPVLAPLARGR